MEDKNIQKSLEKIIVRDEKIFKIDSKSYAKWTFAPRRESDKVKKIILVSLVPHSNTIFEWKNKYPHVENFLSKHIFDITNKLRSKMIEIKKSTISEKSLYGELIGISQGIEKVAASIDKVKDSSYPVLIMGETGVGKEVVANIIHKKK